MKYEKQTGLPVAVGMLIVKLVPADMGPSIGVVPNVTDELHVIPRALL